MRAQKNCVFLLLPAPTFQPMVRVAENNKTHWVRSPKAVRPKLRGASRDTRTCTHTTAHTIPVHLPGCRTGNKPTLRVNVRARPVSPLRKKLSKYQQFRRFLLS